MTNQKKAGIIAEMKLESRQGIVLENQRLLDELEEAYKNMEMVIESSNMEKEIAYRELQVKYEALEELYAKLSQKENLLVHMEKLSSIGQFITEMIHELSSPLTAITLQAQLAKMKKIPEYIKKDFNIIVEHAERMTNLLSRFKAMAYKSKQNFKQFDLNENIRECLETIEIIKPKQVEITIDLCSEPLLILGDPDQVNQIYLNLVKNAFDAMQHQGNKLRVRSVKIKSSALMEMDEMGSIQCQKEEEWNKIIEKNNDFAIIEFGDQGSGIPQEIVNDIFQPFFTTKQRGKGTGLGLSICSDIVLRHNGNLAVKSSPGKGTIIQVILPIVEENDGSI